MAGEEWDDQRFRHLASENARKDEQICHKFYWKTKRVQSLKFYIY